MAMRNSSDVDASGVDHRVPAECVLATRDGQLPGAELRVYHFHSHHTTVPPLRDIALIGWQTQARIALRCGSISGQTQMSPWDFSILSPGNESIWRWNTSFQAVVLYLNRQRLADIAADVFDRQVDAIQVREAFQLQDPIIRGGVASLAAELRDENIGSALYAEALMVQLCVHLLRHHADARFRELRCPGGLSAMQARQVADFIESNLATELSLAALSRIAGMSQYHFARLFKTRFGVPPHAYVQRRRAERARHLLLHSDMALKEIVYAAGFYDQSHLTKSFKRAFGATPTGLRKAAGAH